MYQRIRENRIQRNNNRNNNNINNNNNKNKKNKIDKNQNKKLNEAFRETAALRREITGLKSSVVGSLQSAAKRLSAHELEYLIAMVHPSQVRLPRTIGTIGVHTQPVTARGTFEFTVGTGGFGWISMSPRLVNNRDSLTYTTSAFAGLPSDAWSIPTTVSSAHKGDAVNLPYDYSNWTSSTGGSNMSGRLISFGIEIRYAGTLVDRSGVIITISDPSCRDLGGITMSEALAQQHAVKYINNETDVAYCTVYPRKEFQRELNSATENLAVGLQEFPDQAIGTYYDYAAANSTKPNAVGVALISAKAGTQFTVTYTMHVEYAGTHVSAVASAAPATPNAPHLIHQMVHEVHSKHAHDGKISPIDHVSDTIYNHGFSAANNGFKEMQKSKSPYVSVAGFAGSEVLKLAGPSIKNGMRKGSSQLFKKLF